MERFQELGFDNDTISIFNMHDMDEYDGLVAGFYCQYLGEASHTCQELRNKSDPRSNPSGEHFEYDRLVRKFVSWMEPSRQKQMAVTKHTKAYHDLKKTMKLHLESLQAQDPDYQFPRTCMSNVVAADLRRASLAMEEKNVARFLRQNQGFAHGTFPIILTIGQVL